MALTPTQQGEVHWSIPAAADTDLFTSYKVFGNLKNGKTPVIAIHGGPGSGHEYLLTFAQLLSRYGIPVVFYDQVGCASSKHVPHLKGDPAFWQESTFITELETIIEHLHLRDGPGFDLLGHSWGGMLSAAYASSRPRGLRRLILANPAASVQSFFAGIKDILSDMPQDVQDGIAESIRTGDYSTPANAEANLLILKRHFYRLDDFPPPELQARIRYQNENPVTRESLLGPSYFNQIGTLKDWTCIDRIPNINVPTLLYNAEFDTSRELTVAPFFELIPRVRWITFQNGAHMCHLEGELREKVLKVVGDFLTQENGM